MAKLSKDQLIEQIFQIYAELMTMGPKPQISDIVAEEPSDVGECGKRIYIVALHLLVAYQMGIKHGREKVYEGYNTEAIMELCSEVNKRIREDLYKIIDKTIEDEEQKKIFGTRKN